MKFCPVILIDKFQCEIKHWEYNPNDCCATVHQQQHQEKKDCENPCEAGGHKCFFFIINEIQSERDHQDQVVGKINGMCVVEDCGKAISKEGVDIPCRRIIHCCSRETIKRCQQQSKPK